MKSVRSGIDGDGGRPISLVLDGALSPAECDIISWSKIVFIAPDRCRVFTWEDNGVEVLEATVP